MLVTTMSKETYPLGIGVSFESAVLTGLCANLAVYKGYLFTHPSSYLSLGIGNTNQGKLNFKCYKKDFATM